MGLSNTYFYILEIDGLSEAFCTTFWVSLHVLYFGSVGGYDSDDCRHALIIVTKVHTIHTVAVELHKVSYQGLSSILLCVINKTCLAFSCANHVPSAGGTILPWAREVSLTFQP